MKRSWLLALLVTAGTAAAQTPFGMTGPGQDIAVGSARAAARGGWGVAESDTLSPSFINPAALADLHQFAVVFSGTGEKAASETDVAGRTALRTFLPEVQLSLPLRGGRLAFHGGLSSRRSLEYRAYTAQTWDIDGQSMRGYEAAVRDGTLYRVPLGLSWRAASWLALGAGVDLVRGPVLEQVNQVVADTFGVYLSNKLIQKDTISGTTATVALLLEPRGPVALGVTYSPAHDADFARESSIEGVGRRHTETSTIHLPDELRAGLQVDLGGLWRLGVDGKLARWSKFTGLADWEAIVRDEWTVGAGLERRLQFRPQGRGHNIPLRVGYTWRRWAYEVGGNPIDERTISLGTGFPFRGGHGTIDFGLAYVLTGDQDKNGMSARTWRLSVSVTSLERLIF